MVMIRLVLPVAPGSAKEGNDNIATANTYLSIRDVLMWPLSFKKCPRIGFNTKKLYLPKSYFKKLKFKN